MTFALKIRPVNDGQSNKERLKLVAATANRLRLVQADLADEPEQTRRDYLSDEVQRAVSKLTPQEREAFLKELREQFPTWDAKVDVRTQHVVATPTDQKELKDPAFLLTRLVELAEQMPAEQKREAVERLRAAGFPMPTGGMQWPDAPAAALRQKLQMAAGEALDAGHVLEALVILLDMVRGLDQLVWTTWNQVNARSQFKRPAAMMKNMARFLAGSPDVPRGQVSQDVEKLRQLVAALIGAIGTVGRQFAHNHATTFSPSNVEALAKMEKSKGIFQSQEARNWHKYVELASSRDQDVISNEIMAAIAEFAESLMRGLPGR